MDPFVLEILRRYWRGAKLEDERRQEACRQLSQSLAAHRKLTSDVYLALDGLSDEVLAQALEALARGNPVVAANLRALGAAEGARRSGPARGRGSGAPVIDSRGANATNIAVAGDLVSSGPLVDRRSYAVERHEQAGAPPPAVSPASPNASRRRLPTPRPSPAPRAGPGPRAPDLEISIRLAGGYLEFEVHAADPAEGIHRIRFHSVPLAQAPEKPLNYLFDDIKDLRSNTGEDRLEAENTLVNKGLEIWDIFPEELQEILWHRRRRPLTVWIQSDEPYIPWELAKLQGRRGDRIVSGPFLCEAFAVTRWLHGIPPKTHLPLSRMALVVPEDSKLPNAQDEAAAIRTLAERNGRQVSDIEPKAAPVREALAAAIFDGWHFTGHGSVSGAHPDRASIHLDGSTQLSAEDLRNEAANLGRAAPLVFFNGCTTGRRGFALTGLGGWPQRFLEAGAGAFLGTYWEVRDRKAGELAATVYKGLFRGLPIGRAVRWARRALHRKYPGDATWLAYTIFAHPLASCGGLTRR